MIIGYLLLLSSNLYLVIFQFIILGLIFGTANNLQLVMLSDSTSNNKQGEILGFRTSLAMLGNSIICVLSGFIIIFSINITILISIIFILLSFVGIVSLKQNK
ncbi:hypothetical protein CDV26_07620 [Francisella halioticida]|uniref:Major facilitator superfamily (MFS) profile domain-containing protein n=1 Tax=Francisella halioticida TaxID=549298 RepID=A0ABM6M009_9GAMM|nr:hypothetical protein CDV26_07620 [Francisella halioticida]